MGSNNKPAGLPDVFKVSFENTRTGSVGYFFVNGIVEILSQPIFSKSIQIENGKESRTSSIREEILKDLSH